MTRQFFVERELREVYNGYIPDSATITYNLANSYLSDAIAAATKEHYKESLKFENISFINNSFYTTYRGLTLSKGDEFGYWTATLPEIPLALGKNEAIENVRLYDKSMISQPLVMLGINQINQYEKLPKPLGIATWNEGSKQIFNSPQLLLVGYTMAVRMVSGGNTDLSSEINVPNEWFPFLVEYVNTQLMRERAQAKVTTNEGTDGK